MELTDETGHRALLYVKSVQRYGHAMAVADFEAYMERPGRRGSRAPVKRRLPARNPLTEWLTASQAASESIREAIFGRELEEIVDPGAPAEPVAEWLVRVGWLRVQDERVQITALGDAVLANLEQSQLAGDRALTIKLDQGDDLALAKVIGQIATVGECALVDPYFSLDGLIPILQSTRVTRVLTGSRDRKKLAMLEVALATLSPDRAFEIRKSDVFHDRFVVPPAGSLWLLGTSLNGVGNRLSMMVEVTDEGMTRAISAEFEQAWENAEPVVAATVDTLNAAAAAAEESPPAEEPLPAEKAGVEGPDETEDAVGS